MVLRKQPPPGIEVPPRGTSAPDIRSPVSRSSASPRSAGHRSSRKDSWELDTESIYSPDLHTSPAFDLMPLEEAQKSPMSAHNPWEDELVERPNRTASLPGNLHQGIVGQSYGSQHGELNPATWHVPQMSIDTARRQPTGDIQPQTTGNGSISGAQPETASPPQRFRPNNPFVRARNPSPNPWEGGNQPGQAQAYSDQASAVSSFHQDASERNSQTSGIIPMTARLSIFDQPEDPWTQQNSQSSLQEQCPFRNAEPVVQHNYNNASENIWQLPPSEQSTATNPHWTVQPEQAMDSNNEWQEIRPNHASSQPQTAVNNSVTLAPNNAQSSSPHLIDLDDTPTKAETNAWSGEAQPSVPPKDGNYPPPATSQVPPAPTPATLRPMSEAELKRFQEKQAETYAIRHVNWTDATGKLRESPVLVQNKNGPCPLLALVNGLVMRSVNNKDVQQPIIRALQTRENISLGLLIQALFDELTTYADEELPDIEALSRFLTMLHTGMNVNPRLILESPTSVGTFNQTSDLRFYDAFRIPLLHGWIAEPTSDAHASMVRIAQYYEDIQLLQFRKEELEDRVIRNGSTLTPDEERLIADIDTIQYFVNVENATQLSRFGIDHLSKTLGPGSISILFRNDHFSTLYKHPHSGQLFTLITDAGYADHPEIVWESLVDVTGSNAEFFAGDFRPVGHGPSGSSSAGANHLVGQQSNQTTNAGESGGVKNTEQEDADYAYALSLQFQEEAKQQEQQRRQQRSHTRAGSASQNGRSSSSTVNTSNATARGMATGHRYTQSSSFTNRLRNQSSASTPSESNNDNNNNNNLPLDAPSDRDNDDDAPPPSYDQVTRNKALYQRQQQQQQQRQRQSGGYSSPEPEYARRGQYPGAAAMGRRQQEQWPPVTPTTLERGSRGDRSSKDCIVM